MTQPAALRPAELLMARHGQAWCNVEQTIGGPRSCRGLTQAGREQAASLAASLATEHHTSRSIDVLYASPLLRARETAEIIAVALGIPPIIAQDLREPDYGSADGSNWADVVAAFGAAPSQHPDKPVAPGAETWLTHLARARATLSTILHRHPSQRILIVAHGETVAAAHHHFLDVEAGQMLALGFEADQSSLTVWRQQPSSWFRPADGLRWTLHRHNDTTHLRPS